MIPCQLVLIKPPLSRPDVLRWHLSGWLCRWRCNSAPERSNRPVTYAIIDLFPNIAHSWCKERRIQTVLRLESSRLRTWWWCVCIHRPEVASTLHTHLYWHNFCWVDKHLYWRSRFMHAFALAHCAIKLKLDSCITSVWRDRIRTAWQPSLTTGWKRMLIRVLLEDGEGISNMIN